MSFQKSVRFQQAAGLPGEVAKDGPLRSETMRLIANPDNAVAPIAFGRAFGYADPVVVSNPNDLASINVAIPGGTNFAGLLIHPKAHTSRGTSAGPLEPVYSVPPETWGELATMGIFYATVKAADAASGVPNAAIGYDADGALVAFKGAVPASTTVIPGARLVSALGANPAGGLAIVELTTIGVSG